MRKYVLVGGNGQRGLSRRSEMDRRHRRLRNRPMLQIQLEDWDEMNGRDYDDDYRDYDYDFDWECSCCPCCGRAY